MIEKERNDILSTLDATWRLASLHESLPFPVSQLYARMWNKRVPNEAYECLYTAINSAVLERLGKDVVRSLPIKTGHGTRAMFTLRRQRFGKRFVKLMWPEEIVLSFDPKCSTIYKPTEAMLLSVSRLSKTEIAFSGNMFLFYRGTYGNERQYLYGGKKKFTRGLLPAGRGCSSSIPQNSCIVEDLKIIKENSISFSCYAMERQSLNLISLLRFLPNLSSTFDSSAGEAIDPILNAFRSLAYDIVRRNTAKPVIPDDGQKECLSWIMEEALSASNRGIDNVEKIPQNACDAFLRRASKWMPVFPIRFADFTHDSEERQSPGIERPGIELMDNSEKEYMWFHALGEHHANFLCHHYLMERDIAPDIHIMPGLEFAYSMLGLAIDLIRHTSIPENTFVKDLDATIRDATQAILDTSEFEQAFAAYFAVPMLLTSV